MDHLYGYTGGKELTTESHYGQRRSGYSAVDQHSRDILQYTTAEGQSPAIMGPA